MRAWSEPTAGRGASPLGEERIARGHGRHEPAGRGASPLGQERIAGACMRYRTDVIDRRRHSLFRTLVSRLYEVQEAPQKYLRSLVELAETVKS
jgi:hypothetical protein